MEPISLRELILKLEGEVGTAINRNATIGTVLYIAKMVLSEIEMIKGELKLKTNNKEDSFDKIQIISRELQTEKHPRSLLVRILTELVDTEREKAREEGETMASRDNYNHAEKEGRQQAFAEVREIVKELQKNRPMRETGSYLYGEALTDLLTKLEEKKI